MVITVVMQGDELMHWLASQGMQDQSTPGAIEKALNSANAKDMHQLMTALKLHQPPLKLEFKG